MDSDEMLVLSLLATERWLDYRGWDQPAIVLALLPEAPDGVEVPGLPRDDGTVALFWQVLGEGDPYEILDGAEEPEAAALVAASEAYAWPSSVPPERRTGRSSESPDAVEVRMVLAVTRAGEVRLVTRPRGGEPDVEAGGGGPSADAMRAALGVRRPA